MPSSAYDARRSPISTSLRRAEIPICVRGQIEEGHPSGDVLAERFGIDLVQRVVGRVVIVEIVGAILAEINERDA
jgi:hypothetical protein